MNIKLYYVIFFIHFFSFVNLLASDTRFYNIGDKFGVSLREVFSICKDKNDFIWGSSKTGVIRISGNDFRKYHLPFLSSNNYYTRLAYHNSLLIAYTDNGEFFVYDNVYDNFKPLFDLRSIKKKQYIDINKVIVNQDNTLWVSATDGLSLFREGELEPAIPNKKMQCVERYDENHLLVASTESISIWNKNTRKPDCTYQYKINNEYEVSSFMYDSSTNLIWVGTISNGLLCLKKENNTLIQVPIINLPQQPILVIQKNHVSGNLFVGIDGKGMYEISKDGDRILNTYTEDVDNPYSLIGNGVYDILIDNPERIWVATYTGGLSYMELNQSSVTQLTHQVNKSNSLVSNYVNKVIEDENGNVWFATNTGISRWNRHENRWDTYLSDKNNQANVFLALCEDDEGYIWAGTYSSGVYKLDSKSGKIIDHYFHTDKKNGISGRFISDIFKDSAGNMWMGGTRNVICFLKEKKQFRIYNQQPVYVFDEISSTKLLLGCTYGLLSLDKSTGKSEILVNNVLVQDLVVIENDVWIATSGSGLIRYNILNRTIEKYTTESGLLSNYINSIIREEDNFWLGTENGLCCLNIKNKKVYTHSDLQHLSTVSFNANSGWKLNDGTFIWGTDKGAIMFDPNLLGQKESKTKIFYQDIIVSGSSIKRNDNFLNGIPVNKLEKLVLDYKQNNFIVELLSTGITNTDIRFSWKLEGVDLAWAQSVDNKFITYTNLPSGTYDLKIRMYDSTFSRIIDERTITIQLTPPFWETWWFRIITAIVVISLLSYAFRSYLNNLKQKHAKDKIHFFTNIAHDIRTSLTLICAPIDRLKNAGELTDKSRFYVNLAANQSDRLSSIATQLLDFEKTDIGKGQLFKAAINIVQLISNRSEIFSTAAEKRRIRLEFHSNLEVYITAIDELKIEKVVDNLISNAIKYSHEEGFVQINLNCEKKQWSLEIKDNGLGISKNAQQKLFKEFYREDNSANSRIVGSGIGLLLVKNYVTMHGGQITFSSIENVGSTFKIVIPYLETKAVSTILPTTLQESTEVSVNTNVYLTKESSKDKFTHILIAEDNKDLLEFLSLSLGEHYKITKAKDGEEAWKLIQKEPLDLIVSDLLMPNMDGLELCRKLKSTFETSHIPIILLTSLSQKTKQLEGLALGADDYITKPFDISLLLQRIKSIIKNREIIREKAFKLMNQTQQDEPVYANELNDQFVKKALELVQQNITNSEFGKNEFASNMHVSPSLLYQKLKLLTGQSPIDFIRTIRFNQAMELLQTHKYSIAEVSEMCGFSSASYFSKAFKKYFGKLPVEV
ncbi:MAG: response regulator [Dysgonomonas sp.]|uniref:hybrid sensor histidine kinase/response regulator transcription factor n=1 Tax=Dysgonomonas sp. TaxID=1891233 RepID=UPI0039E2C69B